MVKPSISSVIKQTYLDPKHPGSFSSPERLFFTLKLPKNASLKTVKHSLNSDPTYVRHKRVRHKFTRRKVVVPGANFLWQSDLIILNKLKNYNSKFTVIHTVIDVFSKVGYAVALKDKSGPTVAQSFENIFKNSGNPPRYLESDEGKEFFNKDVAAVLKKHNVVLYNNQSPFKSCIVERFNRTIMTKLSKYMHAYNKKRYVDVIQNVIHSYNHTVHSSTKFKPAEVTKENEMEVFANLYRTLYSKSWSLVPRFKVGQFVHIKISKDKFEKGYTPTFSTDVYKIAELVPSKPLTYKLLKSDGSQISGAFYKEELTEAVI